MLEDPVCEITVTGAENGEWQGSVYFPASGKRQSFQSLLELIKAVERDGAPTGRTGMEKNE